MIRKGTLVCPECGGELKGYDTVKRWKKTTDGKRILVYIPRKRCKKCNKLHRELPDDLVKFKQYEKEVIDGVREGLITPDTLGYQDFPCELTMKRWKT